MIRPSMLIRHSPNLTPGRDSWQETAACADSDPDLWFIPGQGDAWEQPSHAAQRDAAKAVCASCPAIAECLAEAQRIGDKDSIRGGLTPVERERLRRKAKRPSQAKAKCRNGHDTSAPGTRDSGNRCRKCRSLRESRRKNQERAA